MPKPTRQIDSRIGVVTPENIAFEYRVAGPFSRVGAYLLDVVIQLLTITLTLLLMSLAYGMILYALALNEPVSLWAVLGNLGAFAILTLWFFLQWFYGAYFEYRWNGQTPGKRAVGLRTLRVDGRPITLRQAILRNVMRVIDAQPPLPAGAVAESLIAFFAPIALSTHLTGLVAAACSRRHQRLGDLVCGTMVIAEERSPVGGIDLSAEPEVTALLERLPPGYRPGRSLQRAVSHYVSRRRYFGPKRRAEIAAHVGGVLIEWFNLPPETDCDLLMCALYRRASGDEAAAAPGGPGEAGPAAGPDPQPAAPEPPGRGDAQSVGTPSVPT